MRNKMVWFSCGVLVTLLCAALAVSALAVTLQKQATLEFANISLVVDGAKVQPKDATGKIVEPFIIDGTTYVPVRAVGEALGMEVSWNQTTKEVSFTSLVPVEIRKVTVSTPKELLDAIGPNTEITLKDGVYDLSSVAGYMPNPYVTWQAVFDGEELWIQDVKNLSIRGGGREACELTADPRYATVLNFQYCVNVDLSGFEIGHTQKGDCSGCVMSMQESNDITVEDVGLYGCGTYGFFLFDVQGFTANRCDIYDCSYGAVAAEYGNDVTFRDCTFRDMTCYTPFAMNHCQRVSFEGCTMKNIDRESKDTTTLFRFFRTYNVAIKNCTFTGNHFSHFIEGTNSEITLERNTFQGNDFTPTILDKEP